MLHALYFLAVGLTVSDGIIHATWNLAVQACRVHVQMSNEEQTPVGLYWGVPSSEVGKKLLCYASHQLGPESHTIEMPCDTVLPIQCMGRDRNYKRDPYAILKARSMATQAVSSSVFELNCAAEKYWDDQKEAVRKCNDPWLHTDAQQFDAYLSSLQGQPVGDWIISFYIFLTTNTISAASSTEGNIMSFSNNLHVGYNIHGKGSDELSLQVTMPYGTIESERVGVPGKKLPVTPGWHHVCVAWRDGAEMHLQMTGTPPQELKGKKVNKGGSLDSGSQILIGTKLPDVKLKEFIIAKGSYLCNKCPAAPTINPTSGVASSVCNSDPPANKPVGYHCDFVCQPGMQPKATQAKTKIYNNYQGNVEDGVVQCLPTGWDVPVCSAASCMTAPVIEPQHHLSASSKACQAGGTYHPHDDKTTCIWQCESGYQHVTGVASGQWTCVAGNWSQTPTCSEKDCIMMIPALDAHLVIDGGCTNKTQTSCTFTCDPGYAYQQGNQQGTIACSKGEWSPAAPTCTPSSCAKSPAVGKMEMVNGCLPIVGTPCHFTCPPGYTALPSSTVTCIATISKPLGVWSFAECRENNCTSPVGEATIEWDANCIADTSNGSSVGPTYKCEFSCAPKHELKGRNYVQCKAGEWEYVPGGSPPVCQLDKCYGKSCVSSETCLGNGVCDPITGQCIMVERGNDTQCNDNNPNTAIDYCDKGICIGIDLCANVTCTAKSSCHQPGVCNITSGECSNPVLPTNTKCDDGDQKTTFDVCDKGKCQGVNLCESVSCSILDDCHELGECQYADGKCSNPEKRNGLPCNDTDYRTVADRCNNGKCIGVNQCSGVECPKETGCTEQGKCDYMTGKCVTPNKATGTPCEVSAQLNDPHPKWGSCLEGRCKEVQILCEKLEAPSNGIWQGANNCEGAKLCRLQCNNGHTVVPMPGVATCADGVWQNVSICEPRPPHKASIPVQTVSTIATTAIVTVNALGAGSIAAIATSAGSCAPEKIQEQAAGFKAILNPVSFVEPTTDKWMNIIIKVWAVRLPCWACMLLVVSVFKCIKKITLLEAATKLKLLAVWQMVFYITLPAHVEGIVIVTLGSGHAMQLVITAASLLALDIVLLLTLAIVSYNIIHIRRSVEVREFGYTPTYNQVTYVQPWLGSLVLRKDYWATSNSKLGALWYSVYGSRGQHHAKYVSPQVEALFIMCEVAAGNLPLTCKVISIVFPATLIVHTVVFAAWRPFLCQSQHVTYLIGQTLTIIVALINTAISTGVVSGASSAVHTLSLVLVLMVTANLLINTTISLLCIFQRKKYLKESADDDMPESNMHYGDSYEYGEWSYEDADTDYYH